MGIFKSILEPALCLAIKIQTRRHQALDYEEVGWGRPESSMKAEPSPDEVSRGNKIQRFYLHVIVFTYPLSLSPLDPLHLEG